MPDQPPPSAPAILGSPAVSASAGLWPPLAAGMSRVSAIGLDISLAGTGAQAGDVLEVFDGAGAALAGRALDGADIAAGRATVGTPALADGAYAVTARLQRAGEPGAASAAYRFTVDTVAPGAPVVSTMGGLVNARTVLVSGTAEPGTGVYVQAGSPYSPTPLGVTVIGGQDTMPSVWPGIAASMQNIVIVPPPLPLPPTLVAADGTWSTTVSLGSDGRVDLFATGVDGAGNLSGPAAPVTFEVDATRPFLTGASAYGPAGFQAGRTATLFVTFNEAVVVDAAGGTPAFSLAGGGVAPYASISADGRTLGFDYQVRPGDTPADLVVASFGLGGGTIQDAAGNDLSQYWPGLVSPGTAFQDLTPPVVLWVEVGGGSFGGTFSTGDTVYLSLVMSEAVSVDLWGGTPTLLLNNGGVAAYVPGRPGDLLLSFAYTPRVGQSTMSLGLAGLSLNGATMRDAAGNDADLSKARGFPERTVRIAAEPLSTTVVEAGVRSSGWGLGLSTNSVILSSAGGLQSRALYNVAALQFIDGRLVLDTGDPVVAVASLYRAALGRRADQAGLEHWAGLMRGAGPGDVARGILASAEWQAVLGPGLTDAGFVAGLYRNGLGREAEGGGQAFWVGKLAAGASRADVLAGVGGSEEARTATVRAQGGVWDLDEGAAAVARLYQAALGRAPDAGGLAFWTRAVNGGALTVGAVADALLASDEGRAAYGLAGGAGFVQAAYGLTMGRGADAAGAAYWTAQLEAGASRGAVLAGLSESAEHVARTAADVTGSGPAGFGVRMV